MREISLKKLRGNVKLPMFGTVGASGADLFASAFLKMYTKDDPDGESNLFQGVIDASQKNVSITLYPFERVLIGTGIVPELPPGFEWQIRPRSGLALKQGLTVLNTPGTIDSDFRGEVGVILINLGFKPVNILIGDRIAQAVLMPVPDQPAYSFVEEVDTTERGSGGFGHTGM